MEHETRAWGNMDHINNDGGVRENQIDPNKMKHFASWAFKLIFFYLQFKREGIPVLFESCKQRSSSMQVLLSAFFWFLWLFNYFFRRVSIIFDPDP